jgi:hypothetical protein
VKPTRTGTFERTEALLREREAAHYGESPRTSVQHEDLDVTIVSIPRRDGSLRLRVKTYQGSRPFVDLRLYPAGADGILRPSMRGVSIRMSEIDELIAALERARDRIAAEESHG